MKTLLKFNSFALSCLRAFALSCLCAFALSCNNPERTGVIYNSSETSKEDNIFIVGNQKIVELENENIELFVKRYKWKMLQTNTGLRYEIIKEGNGNIIKIGDLVTLESTTNLLSGEEIYINKNENVKQFIVNKSDEIAGLHEAVQFMKRGAEARLIIPTFLAYGVSGDGNKIKPYETIIMKIKIL